MALQGFCIDGWVSLGMGGGGVGRGIEILMDHLTQGKSGNGKNARTM